MRMRTDHTVGNGYKHTEQEQLLIDVFGAHEDGHEEGHGGEPFLLCSLCKQEEDWNTEKLKKWYDGSIRLPNGIVNQLPPHYQKDILEELSGKNTT